MKLHHNLGEHYYSFVDLYWHPERHLLATTTTHLPSFIFSSLSKVRSLLLLAVQHDSITHLRCRLVSRRYLRRYASKFSRRCFPTGTVFMESNKRLAKVWMLCNSYHLFCTPPFRLLSLALQRGYSHTVIKSTELRRRDLWTQCRTEP